MNRLTLLLTPALLAGLLTVSCAGGPSPRNTSSLDFKEIRGREWLLTALLSPSGNIDLSRQKLETEEMGDYYTLRFDEGRLNGTAAPNRYSAPYAPGDNQTLSIGPSAATLMMGIRTPELAEQDYFAFLNRVSRWHYEAGKLELYTFLEDGREAVLIFQEAPSQ
jgi:heat shock protein HslJ